MGFLRLDIPAGLAESLTARDNRGHLAWLRNTSGVPQTDATPPNPGEVSPTGASDTEKTVLVIPFGLSRGESTGLALVADGCE
jgi:hypothetical protein